MKSLSLFSVILFISCIYSLPFTRSLIYYNTGTTTKYQNYKLVNVNNVYNEGYQYKDDNLSSNIWHSTVPLAYLFEELDNGSITTPSNGLRSSLPLGTVGQGIFELRGDGRITDLVIFNNAPNAQPSKLSHKWDLNDVVFGFKFNQQYPKILQTSPMDANMKSFSIESLTYSGSYPTSRLIAIDTDWTQENIGISNITLTAFGSFEPFNVNMSSIPAVIFWFDVDNSENSESINMDVFFNWQDIINMDTININSNKNGYVLNKILNMSDPDYFAAGNISITVQQCDAETNQCKDGINTQLVKGQSLYSNWESFIKSEVDSTVYNDGKDNAAMYNNFGISAENITIGSNSVYSFALILSWFFPQRTFNANKQYLGNYYNNLYSLSDEVNDDIINNKLPKIIQNILSWHKLFNSSLINNDLYPDPLKDVYLNGPSYIARTGYFLESNQQNDEYGISIWRQAESWSCYTIDPVHVDGYRSLAYNMIFGNYFQRSVLNMYTYNEIYDNNAPGMISEQFGGSCDAVASLMGTPSTSYGAYGDVNTIYIINMYLQFKFYRDGTKYVADRFAYIKNATNWIIDQSIPHKYGLPYKVWNTNNEHGIIGDINTYNCILYISSLYAMRTMTQYFEPNNADYIDTLNLALRYANGNLTELMWVNDSNTNQGFYRAFWCENGNYPRYALQSDVLYGYLWALILELDQYWEIPLKNILSHLALEYKQNWSKFGLVFMTNRTKYGYHCENASEVKNLKGGFTDSDTWEMANFDHAVMRLYLNKTSESLNQSLEIINVGINKYRELYKDQFDWRDVSSTYNDGDPEISRPICNSHYCRQLIHYAVMWGINGQRLTATTGKIALTLNPMISLNGDNGCLPVMIPQCSFLLCLDVKNKCFTIDGIFGNEVLDVLTIVNANNIYNFTEISVRMSQVTPLYF